MKIKKGLIIFLAFILVLATFGCDEISDNNQQLQQVSYAEEYEKLNNLSLVRTDVDTVNFYDYAVNLSNTFYKNCIFIPGDQYKLNHAEYESSNYEISHYVNAEQKQDLVYVKASVLNATLATTVERPPVPATHYAYQYELFSYSFNASEEVPIITYKCFISERKFSLLDSKEEPERAIFVYYNDQIIAKLFYKSYFSCLNEEFFKKTVLNRGLFRRNANNLGGERCLIYNQEINEIKKDIITNNVSSLKELTINRENAGLEKNKMLTLAINSFIYHKDNKRYNQVNLQYGKNDDNELLISNINYYSTEVSADRAVALYFGSPSLLFKCTIYSISAELTEAPIIYKYYYATIYGNYEGINVYPTFLVYQEENLIAKIIFHDLAFINYDFLLQFIYNNVSFV